MIATSTSVVIHLKCDFPGCDEELMLTGTKKYLLLARAQKLGWSAPNSKRGEGELCKCKAHKNKKMWIRNNG